MVLLISDQTPLYSPQKSSEKKSSKHRKELEKEFSDIGGESDSDTFTCRKNATANLNCSENEYAIIENPNMIKTSQKSSMDRMLLKNAITRTQDMIIHAPQNPNVSLTLIVSSFK